ncbi:MAG: alpha-L-fucosidase [Verrucomicrobiae bacterium]|nr:alpha-L-fucosidase [Verrucomicrobiae bacterium]
MLALLVLLSPFGAAAGLAAIDGVTAIEGRPGFSFKGATAAVAVPDPVILPREISSVCTFDIGDGPSVVDVTFRHGIREAGGACGFAKEGPGTLRVEGEVRLSGFITAYQGTLDLSAAKPEGRLRIHLMGDVRLVPLDAPVELYLNGEKLQPGNWGAPGSVESGEAEHELPNLTATTRVADTGPSRRETWKDLKYGIFSHYVWNGYGMTAGVPNADGSRAATIDELADSFDVPNYVNQLVEAGVQYVVFTAWHSGTCPLYPSAAMDKWAPDRPDSPKHDLLGDVLDECHKRGIRPFFYCHPYQPVAEPHNDWINDLFAELIDRYGERLDGLWIDENFRNCTQDSVVDYRRLMRTIKERNPDLVLTHNNGGFQTYGTDEGVQEVQWEYHEGRMASIYQIFHQTAKSPEDMLVTTVIQAAANTLGGGIQWSIDAHGPGGGSRGGLDASARPILDGFVELFKPIADSVKNTRPSTSYPPPFSGSVVRLANLKWGVATRSGDDKREFLHVLKPPSGDTLMLPPPADGKLFANARLLDGGAALKLHQSDRGLSLTLPAGVSWKSPDTVIVMDVAAPGGVGMVNNTSPSVHFRGPSWKNLPAEGFRADAHQATADGDAFAFTFEGTDVEWIGSRGKDHGKVELTLDGKPQGTIDLSQGQGTFVTLFSKRNLPRGKHTLIGTKRGEGIVTVDAFRVSDLINDADPAVEFASTTRHGASAATLEGLWEPRESTWINGQKFTFHFHGTDIEVFGGAAHGSGDLELTLDGKRIETVHCNVSSESRSLARITGLRNEPHVLVGQYTNPHPAGFISALDGFAVTRPDYWSYQKRRGLGEIGGDAHISAIHNATGSLTFDGSGVEVYVTRDVESRTAHYTLDGGGSSLWVGLNHYLPVTLPRATVFRYPNLVPGRYTVGFTNAANPTGVNFSSVRLAIDAIRIHKGESSSALPLTWGADGRGGSGIWDVGVSENWSDGTRPARWEDFGAEDQIAVFAGQGGTIEVASPVRVHRLVFRSDRFTLTGPGPLALTGQGPAFEITNGGRTVAKLPVRLPDGSDLPPGTYTFSSHPHLVTGNGSLVVEGPSN